jgi:hypothetical protein
MVHLLKQALLARKTSSSTISCTRENAPSSSRALRKLLKSLEKSKVIDNLNIHLEHQGPILGMKELSYIEKDGVLQLHHVKPHVPIKKFAQAAWIPKPLPFSGRCHILVGPVKSYHKLLQPATINKHGLRFPRDPLDPHGGSRGAATLPPRMLALTVPKVPSCTSSKM